MQVSYQLSQIHQFFNSLLYNELRAIQNVRKWTILAVYQNIPLFTDNKEKTVSFWYYRSKIYTKSVPIRPNFATRYIVV